MLLEPVTVALLGRADLAAYKALRDAMLAAHPDAFTSDAAAEHSRSAASYESRFGLGGQREGGQFTLGVRRGAALDGAVSCERDMRLKVRHIGHVTGMMVSESARRSGLGRALLDACIARARAAQGLEMLTLNVTATNATAVRLYERAGFVRYGRLPRAIKLGDAYQDKDHMVLLL